MKARVAAAALVAALVATVFAPGAQAAPEVLARPATGAGPISVAADPGLGRIYVANDGEGTVTVLDSDDWDVVKVIPVGDRAGGIAVDTATHRVFVTSGTFVTRIDGESLAVTGRNQPFCWYGTYHSWCQPRDRIAVNPATGLVYVTTWALQIGVLDGATLQPQPSVTGDACHWPACGSGKDAAALAVDPVTNRIYFAAGANRIGVIDGASNHIIAGVPHGSGATIAVAVDPTRNRVYASTNTGQVVQMDGATNAMLPGALEVPTDYGTAMSVDPATARLFAPVTNGRLAVIDLLEFSVAHVLDLGGTTVAAASDPTRLHAYVTDTATRRLDVIGEDSVAPTVTVAGGPVVGPVPVVGTRIAGTATDDVAGVATVTVTLTPLLGEPVVLDAAVTCASAYRRSCTWEADTTGVLGLHDVAVRATDRAGHATGAALGDRVVVIG